MSASQTSAEDGVLRQLALNPTQTYQFQLARISVRVQSVQRAVATSSLAKILTNVRRLAYVETEAPVLVANGNHQIPSTVHVPPDIQEVVLMKRVSVSIFSLL
jgi:hypothetical protein